MIDNELDGIYHLSSSTSISKFDFAIKLCHSLNISDEYIVSFVKKNIKNKTKRLYNQNLSNVHYVETFHRDLDNISNLFKDFKKNYKKKIYK